MPASTGRRRPTAGRFHSYGKTAYSLYECSPDLVGLIHQVFAAQPAMLEGEPWYQGDHSLFVMQGRPALALTSERVVELMTTVVHTPQDRPELIDCTRLVEAAYALRELIVQLDRARVG